MADLYEFPYFEILKGQFFPEELKNRISKEYSLQITESLPLKQESQGFTRFQVKLYPMWFKCTSPIEVGGFEWLSKHSLNQLAFSSGHRRIFQHLQQMHSLLPT